MSSPCLTRCLRNDLRRCGHQHPWPSLFLLDGGGGELPSSSTKGVLCLDCANNSSSINMCFLQVDLKQNPSLFSQGTLVRVLRGPTHFSHSCTDISGFLPQVISLIPLSGVCESKQVCPSGGKMIGSLLLPRPKGYSVSCSEVAFVPCGLASPCELLFCYLWHGTDGAYLGGLTGGPDEIIHIEPLAGSLTYSNCARTPSQFTKYLVLAFSCMSVL